MSHFLSPAGAAFGGLALLGLLVAARSALLRCRLDQTFVFVGGACGVGMFGMLRNLFRKKDTASSMALSAALVPWGKAGGALSHWYW